jgi:hypothetical protein
MRTISEIFELFKIVLNGGSYLSRDYLITSDGSHWIVDGHPVDTIENKKMKLNDIVLNVNLARELLSFIGEDVSQMFDEYCLIHDCNMFFLFKEIEDNVVLIHITESIVERNVMIEQINTLKGYMKCHYFRQMFNESKANVFYLEGYLSAKSKHLIEVKLKKKEISLTQNFFYNMMFDSMTSYNDLIQSLISKPIIDVEKTSGSKVLLNGIYKL